MENWNWEIRYSGHVPPDFFRGSRKDKRRWCKNIKKISPFALPIIPPIFLLLSRFYLPRGVIWRVARPDTDASSARSWFTRGQSLEPVEIRGRGNVKKRWTTNARALSLSLCSVSVWLASLRRRGTQEGDDFVRRDRNISEPVPSIFNPATV